MEKTLRILSISDIHLGHNKTKTDFIVANLNKIFSNDKVLSQVDMVVFVGDVFDRLLSLPAEDTAYIDMWIAKFLRLCRKYNILVRVLEGTPSHDRQQSERFTILNDIHEKHSGVHLDLKHVKDLSIERIDKFGVDVLYVPDEWTPTTEETLAQVKMLMIEKNLDKVDFAFMHGQFAYQLPAHIKNMPRHSEAEYLAIVKYLIFVGHIHTHSTYERIVSQGSTDRLAHGEEGPKGYVKAIVEPSGDYVMTFIENKGAKRYVTVVCPYESVEDNIRKIDAEVKDLSPESFVRIRAEYGSAILTNLDVLKARWPLLIWSTLADKEDKEESKALLDDDIVYTPINIDKDNLAGLLLDRVRKHITDPKVWIICEATLKEMERV